MFKVLGMAIAIVCIFCAPGPLFAQNIPFNINYQNDLILEGITLFQHDSVKTKPIPTKPVYPLLRNKNEIYEYWQNLKTQTIPKKLKVLAVDHKVFKALYNKPKIDEKKRIRQLWKQVFGIDVWYPYYKVKEIEDWVSEKASIRFMGFKGKPKFENNQIRYVFKKTF